MSDSCLVALPETDRERIGFKDPANPIVVIDFRIDEGFINPLKATTVSHELVNHWLRKAAPVEMHGVLEGRRLQLRVDNASATISENGQPVTDQNLLLFATTMFEEMRQRLGLMTEVVAHLPTLDQLRADLDTFVRTSITHALADDPERLNGAAWLVTPGCDNCSPAGRDQARSALDSYARASELFAQAGQTFDVFAVPVYVPGLCKDDSPVRRNVAIFLTDAVQILLKEIVPTVYAELAPDHEVGEVIDAKDDGPAIRVVAIEIG